MTMWQIRHKSLGYFQGVFNSKAYWSNLISRIEVGIHPFRTVEAAQELVEFACSVRRPERIRLKKEDFIVEPFDRQLDEQFRDLELHKGACLILTKFSHIYGNSN